MAGDGDGDGGKRITRYSDWLLLAASGLPQSLHFQLFQKLTSETFDGGAHFSIEPTSDGRQRRLLLTSSDMSKESHVFLIDHAWTFRLSDAYKQLQEVSGLAERMAALMCVDVDLNSNAEEETEEVVDGISHQNGTKLSVFEAMESVIHGAKENGDGAVRWLELEELDIDDDTFLSLDLSSRLLALCGNKLENVEIIAREVTKFEQLRALWLNNNPVVKNCDSQLENRVLQGLPRLEIYNSRFTAKFGAWALGFCGGVYGKDNPGSIYEGDHQLESVSSLDLRIDEYEKHCKKLQSKSLISPSIQSSTTRSIHHTDGSPLRVYTDLPHVEEFLTSSEFVIISEPKDAGIARTSTQVDEDMKKAAGITDQQYINQFPFEACLVMKHHMADCSQGLWIS
ncbi:hypothetical protein CMV_010731 [Castanea mollissima]|uniref:Tubulin--tyrosine ligase-like protein 12 SET-like domain-containing protein n=1 Tax=Castanea mollissima TaxID=60419 RepID=A0A8J4VLJ8_9ROSI|nr:hypothetical protein CMV_010731 [Castanea mollissima]